MNQNSDSKTNHHFIDITNEVCPMTFVKTKLLIEQIAPGEVLEVRLKGKEPLENVPRSTLEHKHKILSLEPETADQEPFGVHRLRIEII